MDWISSVSQASGCSLPNKQQWLKGLILVFTVHTRDMMTDDDMDLGVELTAGGLGITRVCLIRGLDNGNGIK